MFHANQVFRGLKLSIQDSKSLKAPCNQHHLNKFPHLSDKKRTREKMSCTISCNKAKYTVNYINQKPIFLSCQETTKLAGRELPPLGGLRHLHLDFSLQRHVWKNQTQLFCKRIMNRDRKRKRKKRNRYGRRREIETRFRIRHQKQPQGGEAKIKRKTLILLGVVIFLLAFHCSYGKISHSVHRKAFVEVPGKSKMLLRKAFEEVQGKSKLLQIYTAKSE